MRSFTMAMLLAVSVSAAAPEDVKRVQEWIRGTRNDTLGRSKEKVDLGGKEETDEHPGFTASISYATTLIGVNFVTFDIDVFGGNRTRIWAANSTITSFFQIKAPPETPVAKRRLLQTGDHYEGWTGTWVNPGEARNGTGQTIVYGKNLYGPTDLTNDFSYFKDFASTMVKNETVWELTSPDMQNWELPQEVVDPYDYGEEEDIEEVTDATEAVEEEEEEPEMTPDNMHFSVFRMAESLRFEIKTGEEWSVVAGVRWWSPTAKMGQDAQLAGNMNGTFTFTSAVAMVTGATAVLAVTLF
jgi:hypothetical protein